MRNSIAAGMFLATTALMSPAQAQYTPPPIPPIRETIDENGVDLTRGTVIGRVHSVGVGGPGPTGLSWSRLITQNAKFRDSTAMIISVSGSTYTVSIAGRSESFTLSGGNYISVEKTGATLTASGPTFTYTSADGAVVTFVPWQGEQTQYGGSHRVSEFVYPTGERLTFAYQLAEGICAGSGCIGETSAERLTSVEATNGYRLAFTFARQTVIRLSELNAWMSIATVSAQNMSVDPASQSWPTLTLSGVSSVTDSLSRTTNYTFTSGNLTGIKRPGATTNNVAIAYSSDKVSQVVSDGVTTNYAYSDVNNVRTTTVSDAVTGNRVVTADLATMLVTSDTDELGKITSYEYYPTSGLLKKVTAPEGNTAELEYDARGNRTKTTLNAKPGSGLSPIVTQVSFPASDATQTWKCAAPTPPVTCNKPLTMTDAKGSVTNYEWDNTTGEPAKVTEPAPTTGAVRPETRYSYTSNLYAQYRNSSGVLVNFATPVTRLTGISACQTAASCTGAADESKSTISYGTANVLPVSVTSGDGTGALAATSAFTYDSVGNRLTVDGPLTGTADTTRTRYDAARQVIGVVGPDPDAAGALKHRAQRATYNLDGQVTKSENGTVNSQSDADWANFASLEAVETGYDANARAVTQKLTSGGTTYALTQTSYDAIGRVDCTATRMNSAVFGSLPASACTLGTEGSFGPDRIVKMSWDAVNRPTKATVAYGTADQADEATVTYSDNGRLTTLKDAENNLTSYEYDGFDRPLKTRYPVTTKGRQPEQHHRLRAGAGL